MPDPLRQHGLPVLFDPTSAEPVRRLVPVPLNRPPFREDRLQALLAEHPALLPVDEIEPAFAPLVLLGREVPCEAGSIDAVFVSPGGYVTLVEAKLWDNPEARREVVGQVLDYARVLAGWSFEELDAAARRASGRGVVEAVRAVDPEADPVVLADAISRNLRLGRVLLLVVGNGMREGTERIAAYVQDHPALRFALALVELAFYRLSDDDPRLFVQPRTLARTVEVVRAVVEVREGTAVRVAAPPEPAGSEGPKLSGPRRSITEDVFFEELSGATDGRVADAVRALMGRLEALDVFPEWGKAGGVTLRFADPRGSNERLTLVGLTIRGTYWLGYLEKPAALSLDPEAAPAYLDRVLRLTGNVRTGKGPMSSRFTSREQDVRVLLRHEGAFVEAAADYLRALRASA